MQYGNAFEQGFQAAALKPADFFGNDDVLYLMEDMATGEIRLSILWEWLHKNATLTENDDAPVSKPATGSRAEIFERLLTEEYEKLLTSGTAMSTRIRSRPRSPIAREIVDGLRPRRIQSALVHRPAEPQPGQLRPDGGSRRRIRLLAAAFLKDGTRITENMDW